jgi:fatty-acid desaturase
MAFIDTILEVPSYGWQDEKGNLIKPTRSQLFGEFFRRLNIFKTRKNWLPLTCWCSAIFLLPFTAIFIMYHFNIWLAFVAFAYGMIVMGSHGTIWYHRYCTHNAYVFKNSFWRFITQNLVPKMIPEEIYVVSHHVHHAKSDTPGDPYNANGGFLYCFLADVNHQLIARDLSEADYNRVSGFMSHVGSNRNTYEQYKKWGSVSKPFNTIVSIILSFAFWYSVFYFIGGTQLACALMSGACFWALGVRTFNYNGHGRGKDMRKDNVDYNRKDFSVNQYWPGIVAGEWHNNHHLYPASAQAGFLKHQIDFAWYYIYVVHKLGGIVSYNNSKKTFIKNYLRAKVNQVEEKTVANKVMEYDTVSEVMSK